MNMLSYYPLELKKKRPLMEETKKERRWMVNGALRQEECDTFYYVKPEGNNKLFKMFEMREYMALYVHGLIQQRVIPKVYKPSLESAIPKKNGFLDIINILQTAIQFFDKDMLKNDNFDLQPLYLLDFWTYKLQLFMETNTNDEHSFGDIVIK
ncbi:hypothetical protein RhiirA4_512991 [Rhizophagus irregularis]|uniref:Uncharacterized protein n=1 Tax=Rhizophagus irregularis TaxID=588596 RepID=A0A2I1GC91_9GLOM|nr:hypothetical protein RhiirA4_512991 [Rhizophagus irregularis]